MVNSQTNRTQILQDLQTKAQFGAAAYIPVTSTEEFFVQPQAPLAEAFKKTLEAISGHCTIVPTINDALNEIAQMCTNQTVFCNNPEIEILLAANTIFYNSDPEFARTAKISITTCEALSARTASVAVSAAQGIGRRAFAAPETHIVIAYANQLCADLPEVFAHLEKKYGTDYPSQITIITGPSRTADIEKTLVLGAHGPKKLMVFIISY
ncbi:MAG: LUD domain-containing protein [Bacteroidetes bacterium]|nr:LUD domain-containing protein [Bacteroidota bacterium]